MSCACLLDSISCLAGCDAVVFCRCFFVSLRPAAVLYLKNTIVAHWKAEEGGEGKEGERTFCLDDQSKVLIRDNIIGAIIQSPLMIG
jgi:hypothetical protein